MVEEVKPEVQIYSVGGVSLGEWVCVQTPAISGRNPITGDVVEIKPGRVYVRAEGISAASPQAPLVSTIINPGR